MSTRRALGLACLLSACTNQPAVSKPDLATAPSTCGNGLRDGDESDLDCGGACAPCQTGAVCRRDEDCATTICLNNLCRLTRDLGSASFDFAMPPDVDLAGADLPAVDLIVIPTTCSDGVINNGESDVDCGGLSCLRCAKGKHCNQPSDCGSGLCGGASTCVLPPTCTDDLLNFAESDKDCGGPICEPCADGKACGENRDCSSKLCLDGVCTVSFACGDGAKNGGESDIDCGGPVCAACAAGQRCKAQGDCSTNYCPGGTMTCVLASTCTNGTSDVGESDVDCGGSCPKCAAGLSCSGSQDCASGICTNQKCVAPGCGDSTRNGGESDVDCGGTCGKCADGKSCRVAADCQSGICVNTVCRATPTCSDAIRNQNETDLDCGGVCNPCPPAARCFAGADCQSRICTNNRCTTPACDDGFKNGMETDRDCGGPTCARCAVGAACLLPRDCVQNGCVMNLCRTPMCDDTVFDGSETDLDCGGGCAPCQTGQGCGVSNDCVGLCSSSSHQCLAPGCFDVKRNQDETDADCGGVTCAARCVTDQKCAVESDCVGLCNTAVTPHRCLGPGCFDVKRNQDETDVDCGGATCAARCVTDQVCAGSDDCEGLCNLGVSPHRCVAPICFDEKRNRDETDVDCGGSICDQRCTTGQSCLVDDDCVGLCNHLVSPHLCLPPGCFDGKANQDESDADCGGITCAKRCGADEECLDDDDCTGLCNPLISPHLCLAPDCGDGKKNRDESDVDCGGVICSKRCVTDDVCLVDNDCQGLCNGAVSPHRCLQPGCFDVKRNRDETDVDCGGLLCAERCTTGKRCSVSNDCVGLCNTLASPEVCLPPTCFDVKRNQDETDVDCGGVMCAKRCIADQKCNTSNDCEGLCNLSVVPHLCVAPGCFDGKLNRDESDVDCGGSLCTLRCALGQLCGQDSDCASGLCTSGHCHQVTFASPSPYPVAGIPSSVTVGDLNNDTKLDIVAAVSETSTGVSFLEVLLGDGAGGFTRANGPAGLPFFTGSGPRGVALAQLDGDGFLDAVTVNGAGHSVSVLMSVGDGTFGTNTDYSLGSGSLGGRLGYNLVVADFSGDGKPDIVATGYGWDTLRFVNDGGGVFTAKGVLAGDAYAFGLAAGKLDADNKNDLVLGGGSSSCNTNGLWFAPGLGDANASFGAGNLVGVNVTKYCGTQGYTIDLGDMNNDTKLDIVSAVYNGYPVRIFTGTGDGSFPNYQELSTEYAYSLVTADLNGDGNRDIVTSHGNLRVMLGRGNATFRAGLEAAAGIGNTDVGAPRSIAVGDFNTDGKLDLVSVDGIGNIHVVINTSQ